MKEIPSYYTDKITATRNHFLETMQKGNPIHNLYPEHVEQVEKWAMKIMSYYPNVDVEVVLLSVWLHDIGASDKENLPIHEILSEKETRRYLKSLNMPNDKIEAVAHCVRTHRCKEGYLPQTDEAIIVAGADSASHLTDLFYILMLTQDKSKEIVLEKLDRDIRDIQTLPQPIKDTLTPLYPLWKALIEKFPE